MRDATRLHEPAAEQHHIFFWSNIIPTPPCTHTIIIFVAFVVTVIFYLLRIAQLLHPCCTSYHGSTSLSRLNPRVLERRTRPVAAILSSFLLPSSSIIWRKCYTSHHWFFHLIRAIRKHTQLGGIWSALHPSFHGKPCQNQRPQRRHHGGAARYPSKLPALHDPSRLPRTDQPWWFVWKSSILKCTI